MSKEETSNWYSWISISYLNDLIHKVVRGDKLQHVDLGPLARDDIMSKSFPLFQSYFHQLHNSLSSKSEPSLWPAVWDTVGRWNVVLACIMFFTFFVFTSLVPAIFLTMLVEYFEDEITYTTMQAWFMVIGLFVFPMIGGVVYVQSNLMMAHASCRIRTVLIGTIYRKVLVLSSSAREEYSSGKIATLFSEDVNHISQ